MPIKWENDEVAMAFFFAYDNFGEVHMTLKSDQLKRQG
jgi:hypothetical protein